MNSYITLLIDLIDLLKLKFFSFTHVTLAIVLISVVFNSLLLWYYSGVGDYNGGPWLDTRTGFKDILIKTKKLMFFVQFISFKYMYSNARQWSHRSAIYINFLQLHENIFVLFFYIHRIWTLKNWCWIYICYKLCY